jgi:hypothetical protein
MVRAAGAAVAAAVVAVAGAGPAAAKGPEDVVIVGPSGASIELSASHPAEVQTVHELAEDLRVWEATGGGALLSAAPTEHLGPALTVEWTMYDATPGDPADAPRLVQTLYPYAAGGALVHTEAGQRLFASEETVDGWRLVPDRVGETLGDLQITAELVVPAGIASPPSGASTAPAGGGSGWTPLAWMGAAVAAVAALVGVAMGRDRRGAAVAGG